MTAPNAAATPGRGWMSGHRPSGDRGRCRREQPSGTPGWRGAGSLAPVPAHEYENQTLEGALTLVLGAGCASGYVGAWAQARPRGSWLRQGDLPQSLRTQPSRAYVCRGTELQAGSKWPRASSCTQLPHSLMCSLCSAPAPSLACISLHFGQPLCCCYHTVMKFVELAENAAAGL